KRSKFYYDIPTFRRDLGTRPDQDCSGCGRPTSCWSCGLDERPLVNFHVAEGFKILGLAKSPRESVPLCPGCGVRYLNSYAAPTGGKRWTRKSFAEWCREQRGIPSWAKVGETYPALVYEKHTEVFPNSKGMREEFDSLVAKGVTKLPVQVLLTVLEG